MKNKDRLKRKKNWTQRMSLSALFLLFFLLVGGNQLGSVNAQTPTPPGLEKVGQGVLEAIQQEGEAHVVIALRQTPAMAAARRNIPKLKNEVARVQAQVLSSLGPSEYRGKHQYETVPGLSGSVLSENALRRLAANPHVIQIDLDVGGTGTLGTSVPQIGADLRHNRGNTGEGVVVAFLDTGMDTDHPDLSDDLNQEACFGDNNNSIDGSGFCPNGSDRQTGVGAAEDDAGHGTHTTGIVTSGGVVSSQGVAPDANIVPIKVLNNCTFSGCFNAFSEIVAALDYIIANNATLGVDIINMSLGTSALFNGNCDNSTAFNMNGAASINTLRANGVIAFASSGNNGSGTQMTSPACLSNVVSVGTVDSSDAVANLTNSNATTDIMAPGINILSDAIGGGTTTASGTSMASPHAAGCAALLIESGDATTPNQIETSLESSTVQVTDTTNNLTFPRIDCTPPNVPPVANANGPYTTDEGVDVTLDATGSSDPDGDPLTYEWDLDNDGMFDDASGTAPIFDRVGQDGVFPIALRVTDAIGASDTDETTVTVSNVAPGVNLNSDAPVDENSPVTVSGTISDPGWLDPLTATIDWGDGTPVENIAGTLENSRPDATLTFSVSHTYGDNGVFTAEICGSDDDTTTCETIALQIENVDPTAEIDLSGAILINGTPTFLTNAGGPLDFSGRSTDPGSDDLTLRWDWGDGSLIETTTYLVNPPNPDPVLSPSIQPRDVTDTKTHTFADACLYEISFWAEDDDGGTSAVDTANVIIVGNADQVRSAGYWLHQFRGNGRTAFDKATLNCYLDIVGYMSQVFNEERDASTIQKAKSVLAVNGNKGTIAELFDQQLLAAWLNFANGGIGYNELVDTDSDGVVDTPFASAVANAEAVRLDPNATAAALEEQKDILERINVADEE